MKNFMRMVCFILIGLRNESKRTDLKLRFWWKGNDGYIILLLGRIWMTTAEYGWKVDQRYGMGEIRCSLQGGQSKPIFG